MLLNKYFLIFKYVVLTHKIDDDKNLFDPALK